MISAAPPYTYRGRCVRVVDASTVDLLLDCGFHVYKQSRFRIKGIATPESKAEATMAHITFILSGSALPWPLIVRSYKEPEQPGMWLADIFINGSGVNLGDELIKLQMAEKR